MGRGTDILDGDGVIALVDFACTGTLEHALRNGDVADVSNVVYRPKAIESCLTEIRRYDDVSAYSWRRKIGHTQVPLAGEASHPVFGQGDVDTVGLLDKSLGF